jgi:signal transduction histidine kinase
MPPFAPLSFELVALGLIAFTGGADSPALPLLLLATLVQAAVLKQRLALAQAGLSILILWTLALLRTPIQTETYVRAIVLVPLMVAAFGIGRWFRRRCDLMLRVSLGARAEILKTHKERICEMQTIRGEMAHAIKNPLACIKGLAGLMALEPERAPERLGVLRAEVCRLQAIVDEYLSYARPLSPLTTEAIDVKATLDEVATMHEELARTKQVTLELAHVDAVEIFGDRQKLRHLLIGLVSNAIEASGFGATVELTCRRQCERVIVQVLDRGPGAPIDLLPTLMEPGITTKDNAAGLGLTVARALAAQHGGALRVGNRDGGGFVAELELPVSCPNERRLA